MNNQILPAGNGVSSDKNIEANETKVASWVIRKKESGQVMFETFNESVAKKINTNKYEAVPILKHLQEFNEKVAADSNLKVRF